MLFAVGCAGIYGGSHLGLTDDEVYRVAGYSIRQAMEGELQRAVTSLFFTAGGWRFYSSMAMLAIALGFVELNYGTQRAVTTFLAIHVVTLLIMAVAVLSCHSLAPTLHSHLLFHAKDVGPSAGYYGCLGLAVARLTGTQRIAAVAAVGFVLLVRACHSAIHMPEEGRVLAADLAHLIAYPLGIASSRFGKRIHSVVEQPLGQTIDHP